MLRPKIINNRPKTPPATGSDFSKAASAVLAPKAVPRVIPARVVRPPRPPGAYHQKITPPAASVQGSDSWENHEDAPHQPDKDYEDTCDPHGASHQQIQPPAARDQGGDYWQNYDDPWGDDNSYEDASHPRGANHKKIQPPAASDQGSDSWERYEDAPRQPDPISHEWQEWQEAEQDDAWWSTPHPDIGAISPYRPGSYDPHSVSSGAVCLGGTEEDEEIVAPEVLKLENTAYNHPNLELDQDPDSDEYTEEFVQVAIGAAPIKRWVKKSTSSCRSGRITPKASGSVIDRKSRSQNAIGSGAPPRVSSQPIALSAANSQPIFAGRKDERRNHNAIGSAIGSGTPPRASSQHSSTPPSAGFPGPRPVMTMSMDTLDGERMREQSREQAKKQASRSRSKSRSHSRKKAAKRKQTKKEEEEEEAVSFAMHQFLSNSPVPKAEEASGWSVGEVDRRLDSPGRAHDDDDRVYPKFPQAKDRHAIELYSPGDDQALSIAVAASTETPLPADLKLHVGGRGCHREFDISLPPAKEIDWMIIQTRCPHFSRCKLELKGESRDEYRVTLRVRGKSQGEAIQISLTASETSDHYCPVCNKHMQFSLNQARPRKSTIKDNAFMACLWGPGEKMSSKLKDEKTQRYITDALVLGYSLKETCSTEARVLLITRDVRHMPEMQLLKMYWEVKEVDHVWVHPSRLMNSDPRFSSVFTKFQAWNQTEYKKICLLDLDMIVARGIDEVFGNQTPAALFRGNCNTAVGSTRAGETLYNPRTGEQQGGINAGFIVLEPSAETFAHLQGLLKNPGQPSQAPEQDFLSLMWPGQWTKLHVKYNWQPHQLRYIADRGLSGTERQKTDEIAVFHFSGDVAPRDFLFKKLSAGSDVKTDTMKNFEDSLLRKWGQKRVSDSDEERMLASIRKWFTYFEEMWKQAVKTTVGSENQCPACNEEDGSPEHAFFICRTVDSFCREWRNDPLHKWRNESQLKILRTKTELYPASLKFVAQVHKMRWPDGAHLEDLVPEEDSPSQEPQESPLVAEQRICRDFPGSCKWGKKCKFRHVGKSSDSAKQKPSPPASNRRGQQKRKQTEQMEQRKRNDDLERSRSEEARRVQSLEEEIEKLKRRMKPIVPMQPNHPPPNRPRMPRGSAGEMVRVGPGSGGQIRPQKRPCFP